MREDLDESEGIPPIRIGEDLYKALFVLFERDPRYVGRATANQRTGCNDCSWKHNFARTKWDADGQRRLRATASNE